MTGRWPHTLGLMRSVIPPWRKRGLDYELMTLPKDFRRKRLPSQSDYW